MSSPSIDGVLTASVLVDGSPSEATLSPDGSALRWIVNGVQRCLSIDKEVLGVQLEEKRKIRLRALVIDDDDDRGDGCRGPSDIFFCCLNGGVRGKEEERERTRKRKDFVVEMPMDNDYRMAMAWEEKMKSCLDSLGRPKRLFIILNPYGGRKCARRIFVDEVKPLLEAADVHYTLQETKYQLHAQELAQSLDLFKYDGVVCVSGDGVLVEVLNGLLKREDWKSTICMPLGIIPAGTGNGMVKSLLHAVGDACSVSNAVLAVIQGHKHELDIATVSQGKTLFFSLLMLSWGLVADIDIESEKCRWMGSARLEIYSLIRIINLRKYNGNISFVPAPGFGSESEPIIRLEDNKEPVVSGGQDTERQNGYQGPKLLFPDSEWRTIRGPFVTVWLHNVPWSNNQVMAAPDAKFSDGYFDMIVIKDCPRPALLRILLSMKDGSHVKSPFVLYMKVKAFRLEPGELVGHTGKGGIVDSDGEVIARGKGTYKYTSGSDVDRMTYGPLIEMQVEKGLAKIFSPLNIV